MDVNHVRFNIGLQLRTGSVNQTYNAAHLQPTNTKSGFRYSDAVVTVRLVNFGGGGVGMRRSSPVVLHVFVRRNGTGRC